MPEVIASATKTRDIRRDGKRYVFSATVQLYHLEGNKRPYFSATAELRNPRKRGDNQIEECGCLHEDIIRYFPELGPVVAIHLADDDGTPMYAVENGLYWLGLTAYPDARNLETFAKQWRITPEEAADIDRYVKSDPNPREALTYLAKMAAPYWKKQAEEALATIRGASSRQLYRRGRK